jgi:transcriptional regulator with PAS, ATPase and Fis domain
MAVTYGHTLGDEDDRPVESRPPSNDGGLFVVLEGNRPLAASSRHSLADVRTVAIGRGPERVALRPGSGGRVDLQLRVPDPHMSSRHALLTRVRGKWHVEDSNSKNGTRVNGALATQLALNDGDTLELGHTVFLFRAHMPTPDELDVDATAQQLYTLNPELERQLAQLKRLAPAPEVPLLIVGESGTGKEVLARQIANWSGRPGEFVGVNCGALTDTLVKSELFGHLKGAFSGAENNRPGLIRSAHQGNLFLDEVAELSPAAQASLLRALQEREVVPVGATRAIAVDIRVIAATHQDLDAAVKEGRFRHDLLARLRGFQTRLPALRERREDLGLLVAALLGDNPETPKNLCFTPDAIRALLQYRWPLNIRELRNCLGAAVLLSETGTIDAVHLPETVRVQADSTTQLPSLNENDKKHRDEMIRLLQVHSGNVSAIARDVGKARMQVQRWLKRYRLNPANYR